MWDSTYNPLIISLMFVVWLGLSRFFLPCNHFRSHLISINSGLLKRGRFTPITQAIPGVWEFCASDGTKTRRILYYVTMCLCPITQSAPTLCHPMDSRLLHPRDFPGNNTGVGCHFLLQGSFPTQGLNPGLLNCRWSPTAPPGKPPITMDHKEELMLLNCGLGEDSCKSLGLKEIKLVYPKGNPF